LNFQEEDNFCTKNATAEFIFSLMRALFRGLLHSQVCSPHFNKNTTLDSQELLETARATWRQSQD